MNTTGLLVGVTVIAYFLVGVAATGRKVLHEVLLHELKEYCRRRRRTDVFDSIHDFREEAALGAESVESLGLTFFFASLFALWAFAGWGWPSPLVAIGFAVGLMFSVLAITVWIPTTVAKLAAPRFLFQTWRIWRASRLLLSPWLIGVEWIESAARRASGQEDEPTDEETLEDEIKALVTEGIHDGLMEADTREMIQGIIELGDADVADIMTPRSKIDAIPVELSWPELMERVIQCGRTRIPVYKQTLDNLVGVLYVKDLLRELTKPQDERPAPADILREPWFVPKSRRLNDMLRDFLQSRNHLSIVVDEYMAVEGIVSIEDVLEEIVGEIVDETDQEQLGEIPYHRRSVRRRSRTSPSERSE